MLEVNSKNYIKGNVSVDSHSSVSQGFTESPFYGSQASNVENESFQWLSRRRRSAKHLDLGEMGFVKISNKKEVEAYEKYETILKGIIPSTSKFFISNFPFISLSEGDEVLLLENLNKKQSEDIVNVNIKIGEYCKSTGDCYNYQNQENIEMSVSDFSYDNVIGNSTNNSRLTLTADSITKIQQVFSVIPRENVLPITDKIIKTVKSIRELSASYGFSFVGGSVFMSIDKNNPQETIVKLINLKNCVDLDHPSEKCYNRSWEQFDSGMEQIEIALNKVSLS